MIFNSISSFASSLGEGWKQAGSEFVFYFLFLSVPINNSRAVLQMIVTSIFGLLSTFLTLRTGYVWGAVFSHVFCNIIGPPPIGRISLLDKKQRLTPLSCIACSHSAPSISPSLYLPISLYIYLHLSSLFSLPILSSLVP